MIIKVDIENKRILHNGKIIPIDPFVALSMAAVGAKIEVIEELDENAVVTLKITMPEGNQ